MADCAACALRLRLAWLRRRLARIVSAYRRGCKGCFKGR
jgi:hypothetical protein